jgi:putative ABC transport system ATP-binding protein
LNAMRAALEISGLSHTFGTGSLARRILCDLDLSLHAGEIVLLSGPSGSGKTTLLTLIGGLRAIQRGSCVVLGQQLRDASEQDRVVLRRRIGFVFQDHRLLNFLTAQQNVAMALEGGPLTSDRDRSRLASDILGEVGLAAHIDALPARLSGGQRQRVALARALVREPGLLLADEPTASLDRHSGAEVMRLLSRLARERGAAVLIVTHDMRIQEAADRVIMMEDGIVIRENADSVPNDLPSARDLVLNV